jgi:glutathione synthase/RimK-type ligase-like ATP-grasp enzyme
MDILIIAEKKAKAMPFVHAIREKGSHAKYMRVSKITLVSRQNETQIKALGNELPQYDAAFIQARTSLAPFIEPLLEELQNQECYTNAKKGSYYIGMNELYQFITLAQSNIPIPKTIATGSTKNIEKTSKKIFYPIIAKTFIGKNAQQALIIENSKQLTDFVKSIKTETDGIMLRQYIDADVITCAVIGKKVFAIKRKTFEGTTQEINHGKTYKPTETEEKIAIKAALACGYEIARVDIAKGKIVKVDPQVPWREFNDICSETMEEQTAAFLIEKAIRHEKKKKINYDFLGLKKLFSKTIFGGMLK